ncbi:MAG: ABC transporter permease [Alphaproteobacteria bacterium]|nr:ABC transporter permease [Alphaproteobacteria bacterium]
MVATARGILDRKLLRDLRAFGGQALGIVLVLACAAATVTMSFSVQRSLEASREDFYRRTGFADLFASLPPAPESLADTIRAMPGVAAVVGRVVGHGVVTIDGFNEPITARLMSLPTDSGPPVNRPVLQRGRMPDTDHPDDVLVSQSFAEAHGLGPGSRLTLAIAGQARQLRIAGVALSPEFVFALGPGQIVPDSRRFAIIWMQQGPLAADLGLTGKINDLAIGRAPNAAAADILAALDRLGATGSDRTRQPSHAFVSSQLDELGAIGLIVPAIFLGVAVFLLGASLLRIVELQRSEIGIVKALGFDGSTIVWHYLKFALLLAAAAIGLGVPVGIALGWGVTHLYAEFFHFPRLRYGPDLAAIGIVVAVLCAAALLAAWRPATRALAVQPAIAMRPAAPLLYRRSATLSWRRLGPPAAMVLRQLGRRPLRPLLAMLAMAFAGALQIATLFSFDALDQMVDVFYGRAQRQDATIVFASPLPIANLAEVARWPGVGVVEGRLELPGKVTFGDTSREVVVTGLPARGTLQRLLDPALTPIAAPTDGVALSRRLAEVLGIAVGDRVTIHLLGRRAFDVPVTALVEQYIGLGAYMELAALDRLSAAGQDVTAADVTFAAHHEADFYRALKASPLVAAFVPRAAAVSSFRRTMARTLSIIVSFFVAFAGIAAFAIVDATVRVALSERLRELAILRALGFGVGAVVRMLAGELGIAVVLALPLGCGIGLGLGQAIVWTLDNDLFHVPLVVGWRSYAIAAGVVLAAAALSFAAAARRLRDVDIPAVLRVGVT